MVRGSIVESLNILLAMMRIEANRKRAPSQEGKKRKRRGQRNRMRISRFHRDALYSMVHSNPNACQEKTKRPWQRCRRGEKRGLEPETRLPSSPSLIHSLRTVISAQERGGGSGGEGGGEGEGTKSSGGVLNVSTLSFHNPLSLPREGLGQSQIEKEKKKEEK